VGRVATLETRAPVRALKAAVTSGSERRPLCMHGATSSAEMCLLNQPLTTPQSPVAASFECQKPTTRVLTSRHVRQAVQTMHQNTTACLITCVYGEATANSHVFNLPIKRSSHISSFPFDKTMVDTSVS